MIPFELPALILLHRLDLSSLSKKPARTLVKDGRNYTIAVCAHAGTPCQENGGKSILI